MRANETSRTFLSGSLTRAFRIAAQAWPSPIRWQIGGLLVAVVALTIGTVWLQVQINTWQGAFYNALQGKNQADFLHLLMRFCGLAAAFIVAAVYRQYLQQMLQIRWRTQLTDRLLMRWLDNHAHYRMQLNGKAEDNPDQRIAEDAGMFVSSSLDLTLGFINALLTLLSFIGILWALSAEISLDLAGHTFSFPGYLVWIACAYAAAGSWLAHLIGRPLIGLSFQQQRVEADFRFALARMRENADAVALQDGEPGERRTLVTRFARLVENWRAIMTRQKRLTWMTASYGQIAVIFPYFVAAPAYFVGKLDARRSDAKRVGLRPGTGCAVVVRQRLLVDCRVACDGRKVGPIRGGSGCRARDDCQWHRTDPRQRPYLAPHAIAARLA